MNEVLGRALTDKKKIEMVYIDGDSRMTQRIVRVVAVCEKTILTYCYWRKQVRSFKRKNILSAFQYKQRQSVVKG